MTEICNHDSCLGCAACASACSKHAINMVETEPHGYLYPRIDNSLCIDCGLCQKICPVNNPPIFNHPLKAFAAISKDNDDLMTSSSGGASSVLSTYVISKGGVVYGSVEEDYAHISHQRIASIKDLYKIKGSKYVHSYTTDVYPQVKKDLQNGVEVIFLGTPCQVAGLINFLRKPYDNLTTVDLCCHGVPSQKFLRDDVENLCNVTFRNKGDMSKPWDRWGLYVTFRNKGDMSKPWDRYGIKLAKDETYVLCSPFLKDKYITAFMSGHLFRENCYSCPYARAERVSDITIADFWGYKGHKINSNNGISLLMSNTPKGQSLVDKCKSDFHSEERPVEEAIKGNGQFNNPSIRPKERDAFLEMYPEDMDKAYSIAINDYVKAYKQRILKDKIRRLIKPMLSLKQLLNKKKL